MHSTPLMLLSFVVFAILFSPTQAAWYDRIVLRDDGGCSDCHGPPPSWGHPWPKTTMTMAGESGTTTTTATLSPSSTSVSVALQGVSSSTSALKGLLTSDSQVLRGLKRQVPVSQLSDGQLQVPTGPPVTQISDGQPQAPTGAPVTSSSSASSTSSSSTLASTTTTVITSLSSTWTTTIVGPSWSEVFPSSSASSASSTTSTSTSGANVGTSTAVPTTASPMSQSSSAVTSSAASQEPSGMSSSSIISASPTSAESGTEPSSSTASPNSSGSVDTSGTTPTSSPTTATPSGTASAAPSSPNSSSTPLSAGQSSTGQSSATQALGTPSSGAPLSESPSDTASSSASQSSASSSSMAPSSTVSSVSTPAKASSPSSSPLDSTTSNASLETSQTAGTPPSQSTTANETTQESGTLMSSQSDESTTVLTSTISRNDTTLITVIVSTIISRLSSTEGSSQSMSLGAPPETSPTATIQSPPTPGSGSSLSATPLLPSVSEAPLSCPFNAPAWCVPSPGIPLPSNAYCLCPYCYAGGFICSDGPPKDTSSCPFGWVCSVTIASDSSTPVPSLPPGVWWNTAAPSPWNSLIEIITASNEQSTRTVPFEATLRTSTRTLGNGVRIEFPWRDWECLAFCDSGLGLTLPCLIPIICNPPSPPEWPEPPKPVPPPIGPPELDSELVPKTITYSVSGSPTSGGSSEGSSSTSSSSSSSSCSASPVTTCSNFCSVVFGSPSATETCTSTCTTVTTCSGTDSSTATTANATQACSISAYWNDPAISASIASWISQFPFTFEDTMNMTLLSSATDISSSGVGSTVPITSCTAGLCTITTNGFTLTTGSRSSSLTSPSKSSPTSTTTSSPTIDQVTLTSTTRSFSDVSIFTCGGVKNGASSSCTGSFELSTVIVTTIPANEKTQLCASWQAAPTPVSTTTNAGEGHINCATPVKGPDFDAIPTPWDVADKPFQWFKSPDDQIEKFCSYLEDEGIVIHTGDPDGKKSPAECSISHDASLTIFGPLSQYFLTIQIAFDYNGCEQDDKTDWNEYREGGIDFAKYGAKKCKSVFMDKVVKQCRASDSKQLDLEEFVYIGGLYWTDCMRWTVLAPDEQFQPPDTT